MVVAGALVAMTSNKIDPVDGGVAIWKDGHLCFALPEERVTRVKYDGGYTAALNYALDKLDLTIEDLDALVLTSYGEPHSSDSNFYVQHDPNLKAISDRVYVSCSHHHAHAYAAARLSPYTDNLILILDNEGSMIGRQIASTPFHNSMERASAYISTEKGVELLTRELFSKNTISLGEAFRRASYYCGFPSHQFAGKTMALAAYGDKERFSQISLIEFSDGTLQVNLDTNYTDPSGSILRAFTKHGVSLAQPRDPKEAFHQDHYDVAALIQHQLEVSVVAWAKSLLEATGQQSLCVAGGVAYNCKLIAELEKQLGVPVFVPPSPGDQGIAVGGIFAFLENNLRLGGKLYPAEAYLGGSHRSDLNKIKKYSSLSAAKILEYSNKIELVCSIVKHLQADKVIALVEGKSEYGRRALGARSLIGLPNERVSKKLRELKRREWFRPFGATMLDSFAERIFEDIMPDRYMLRAPVVSDKSQLSNLLHVDNTLRAQLVTRRDPLTIADVLGHLEDEGTIPVLINTSFNLDGHPLVETDDQALQLFVEYQEIDAIVLVNSCVMLTR